MGSTARKICSTLNLCVWMLLTSCSNSGSVAHDNTASIGGEITNPTTQTNSFLSSITYGLNPKGVGVYVAVGGENTILTSPDGNHWGNASKNPVMDNLTSVAYGAMIVQNLFNPSFYSYYPTTNGLFVAVGLGEQIFISIDGANWYPSRSAEDLQNQSDLRGITFGINLYESNPYTITPITGQGEFVAVGDNGTILRSNDYANSWSPAESVPTGEPLFAIAYTNVGKFVAVGAHGTILTSTDGDNWHLANSNTTNSLYAVNYAYSIDSFVAVGESGTVLTSSDGNNWQPESSPTQNTLTSIGYSYGLLFANYENSGKNTITSTDGKHWSNQSLPNNNQDLYSVTATASGNIVMAGREGTVYSNTPSINYTFTQKVNDPSLGNLHGITYLNSQSQFIIVGTNGIYTYDGSSTPKSVNPSHNFLAITQGNISGTSTLVAVGSNGVISTSTNGSAWTPTTSLTNLDLQHVTYVANGTYHGFIATSNESSGVVLYSPDGTSWQSITTTQPASAGIAGLCLSAPFNPPATSNIIGIASNNDYAVTLSSTTASLVNNFTIPGSTNWNCQYSFPTYATGLNNVLYGLSQFITIGNNGMIFTSPTGINPAPQGAAAWVQAQHSDTANNLYNGTASSNNQGLIMVGENGTITISDNATNWHTLKEQGSTSANLNGVACNNSNTCAAVGDSGNIGIAHLTPQTIN